MEKLAFTLKEAAEAANVSEPTMRNWVHIKGFPAFRTGKKWIVPVDAFRRWLEQQAGVSA